MGLQRLCKECPLIDICQHSAELKVTLAEGLILDGDIPGAEDPHFFAIGICLYKVSFVVIEIKQELQRVACFQP